MTSLSETESAYTTLDAPTAQLVDLAAVLAAGTESEMRASLESAAKSTIDPHWVEELVLQTYLFAGFPRTLNGMRLWRRASNRVAETADFEEWLGALWTSRGEQTCEQVYGNLYKRLRANIRSLHPALDTWMIDLYGRVLGRPGLGSQAPGAVHRGGLRGVGTGPPAALAPARSDQCWRRSGRGGRHPSHRGAADRS